MREMCKKVNHEIMGFKNDNWNGLANNTVQATGCCELGDES